MRSRSRPRAIALLLLSASVFPVSLVPATAASSNCNTLGGDGADFTLVQKDTYDTSVFGVAAQIQRQDFDLCGASGQSSDYVSTWSMLIPRTPGNQYAQAGWIKIGNNSGYGISGYHVFSEYSYKCYPNCTGDDVDFSYGPDPSGTVNYQVYLRASDDRIVMRAGSTTLDAMNRDVTGEWSADWSGQWASETHRYWSNIPGTPTNKLRMFDIVKYDSSGNTSYIQTFSPEYAEDSVHHAILVDSAGSGLGKQVRVWTK